MRKPCGFTWAMSSTSPNQKRQSRTRVPRSVQRNGSAPRRQPAQERARVWRQGGAHAMHPRGRGWRPAARAASSDSCAARMSRETPCRTCLRPVPMVVKDTLTLSRMKAVTEEETHVSSGCSFSITATAGTVEISPSSCACSRDTPSSASSGCAVSWSASSLVCGTIPRMKALQRMLRTQQTTTPAVTAQRKLRMGPRSKGTEVKSTGMMLTTPPSATVPSRKGSSPADQSSVGTMPTEPATAPMTPMMTRRTTHLTTVSVAMAGLMASPATTTMVPYPTMTTLMRISLETPVSLDQDCAPARP
mmetsp:Transcript_534/g.2090  ORF Transcript_534/g.2090 Transcript_534/m.2090 type:complete len:304 (-) Transcript_534:581-1492(-)